MNIGDKHHSKYLGEDQGSKSVKKPEGQGSESVKKSVSINELSSDLILYIFSFLDLNLKTYAAASLVCKRWRNILNSEALWKSSGALGAILLLRRRAANLTGERHIAKYGGRRIGLGWSCLPNERVFFTKQIAGDAKDPWPPQKGTAINTLRNELSKYGLPDGIVDINRSSSNRVAILCENGKNVEVWDIKNEKKEVVYKESLNVKGLCVGVSEKKVVIGDEESVFTVIELFGKSRKCRRYTVSDISGHFMKRDCESSSDFGFHDYYEEDMRQVFEVRDQIKKKPRSIKVLENGCFIVKANCGKEGSSILYSVWEGGWNGAEIEVILRNRPTCVKQASAYSEPEDYKLREGHVDLRTRNPRLIARVDSKEYVVFKYNIDCFIKWANYVLYGLDFKKLEGTLYEALRFRCAEYIRAFTDSELKMLNDGLKCQIGRAEHSTIEPDNWRGVPYSELLRSSSWQELKDDLQKASDRVGTLIEGVGALSTHKRVPELARRILRGVKPKLCSLKMRLESLGSAAIPSELCTAVAQVAGRFGDNFGLLHLAQNWVRLPKAARSQVDAIKALPHDANSFSRNEYIVNLLAILGRHLSHGSRATLEAHGKLKKHYEHQRLDLLMKSTNLGAISVLSILTTLTKLKALKRIPELLEGLQLGRPRNAIIGWSIVNSFLAVTAKLNQYEPSFAMRSLLGTINILRKTPLNICSQRVWVSIRGRMSAVLGRLFRIHLQQTPSPVMLPRHQAAIKAKELLPKFASHADYRKEFVSLFKQAFVVLSASDLSSWRGVIELQDQFCKVARSIEAGPPSVATEMLYYMLWADMHRCLSDVVSKYSSSGRKRNVTSTSTLNKKARKE